MLFEFGIKHQRTVVYTPKQNGKAERENRTLVEAARSMLFAKNLPKNLWAEAINTAAYVLNRSRKSNLNKTPIEIWEGKKYNSTNFEVFGTDVYAYVHKSLSYIFNYKAPKWFGQL